jgi:hypothetical protein
MPLFILATAMEAVSAIQKGCEMYKEFKGTVKEVKKTYDEVVGITKEVRGIWGTILSFFSKPKPPPIVSPPVRDGPKIVSSGPVQYSELEITKGLMDNLKVFFECLEQLHQKVRDAEEAALDPTKNTLSSALDIEFALTEVEKLQKQIRETMVYQSPAELGDLYKKVVTRVGVIKEQQELARLEAEKKRKQEETYRWQRRNLIISEVVGLVIALVFVAEFWAVLLSLRGLR